MSNYVYVSGFFPEIGDMDNTTLSVFQKHMNLHSVIGLPQIASRTLFVSVSKKSHTKWCNQSVINRSADILQMMPLKNSVRSSCVLRKGRWYKGLAWSTSPACLFVNSAKFNLGILKCFICFKFVPVEKKIYMYLSIEFVTVGKKLHVFWCIEFVPHWFCASPLIRG